MPQPPVLSVRFACTCPLSSTVNVARGRGRGRDVVGRFHNCLSKETKDVSNASLTRDLVNQSARNKLPKKRVPHKSNQVAYPFEKSTNRDSKMLLVLGSKNATAAHSHINLGSHIGPSIDVRIVI